MRRMATKKGMWRRILAVAMALALILGGTNLGFGAIVAQAETIGDAVSDASVSGGDAAGGESNAGGDVTDGDVADSGAENTESVTLQDAEFTGSLWDDGIWSVTPSTWDNASFEYFTYANDSWMEIGENQGTTAFKFWMGDGGSFTLLQTVAVLPAGIYTLNADYMGADADVQLTVGDQLGAAVSLGGYNVWSDDTATFTVEEDLENVTIGFTVTVKTGGYGYIDSISLEKVAEIEPEVEVTLQDAEFTGSLWDDGIWSVTPSTWDNASFEYFTYANDSWMEVGENQGTTAFKFWMGDGGSFTLLQTIALIPAGTYTLSADFMGADADVQLCLGDQLGAAVSLGGYNVWSDGTDAFVVESDLENVTVGFTVTIKAGGYGYLDSLSLEKGDLTGDNGSEDDGAVDDGTADDGTGEEVIEPVDAEVYVERVENLPEDFIGGFDVSSYVVLKNCGVKFYDFEGNELDDQGFFDFLAECGVNYIRVRVWNDPYDENGNGYGGGNNDIEIAKQIGVWATNAGMKMLVNFHYSDFWADPGRQLCPKAWEGYTVAQKAEALSAYTKDSLKTLLDAGVDVGMVQVGNETNNGIAGESGWSNMGPLFKAGADAVHAIESEYNKEIMVAVHFTNPEKGYLGHAQNLEAAGVDYDVFASSYYPYWHSDIENALGAVASTYGKKVMCVETSWGYTNEDGDGNGNSVGSDEGLAYEFDIHGQALALRDVIQSVANIEGSIGVFYWEPAWIPVQVYDPAAENAAEILAQNREMWVEKGAGWASSYASDYDPDNAGLYWGGSSWDNQALFDFTGHPLDTINIFNYVKTGTNAPVTMRGAQDVSAECKLGETPVLPSQVDVNFTDGSTKKADITWDEAAVEAAIASGVGTYDITGTFTYEGQEYTATCTLVINPENLLPNASFEESNAAWEFVENEQSAVKISNEDPRTGKMALHFWSANEFSYRVEQKITLDEVGYYTLTGYLMGDSAGENAEFKIYVKNGDETLEATSGLNGYNNWDDPSITDILVKEAGTEITVGVVASNVAGGAWGSWDDFWLYKSGDYVVEPDDGDDSTGSDDDNTGTEDDNTGSDDDNTGSEDDSTGTEDDNTGSDDDNTGTEDDSTGTEDDSTGSEDDNTGSDDDNTGTEDDSTGTEDDSTGSEDEEEEETIVDWNKVESAVGSKVEGGNTNVNMDFISSGDTIVPVGILNNIVGRKVTVAFHSGNGIAVSISGNDLSRSNLESLQRIDLTVNSIARNIPENVVATKAAVDNRQFFIKDTGNFGVPVNVHIAAGAQHAEKYANLYRYNTEAGRLEYCGTFRITEKGQAMFAISRGGDYLMTVTTSRVNESVLYSGGVYTVQAGDTLYAIAARHGMSLAELVRRNPQITDINLIRVGQKIHVD